MILTHPSLGQGQVLSVCSEGLALNQDPSIACEILVNSGTHLAALLTQPISLSIAGQWFFHGFIGGMEYSAEQENRLWLRLYTGLYELGLRGHQRVFAQQSLSCIIDTLLQTYPNLHYRLHLVNQPELIAFCPQFDCSDKAFLDYLVTHYGLFFTWQQTASDACLLIYDDQEELAKALGYVQLGTAQQSGMVRDRACVYELYSIHDGQHSQVVAKTDYLALTPGQRIHLDDEAYQLNGCALQAKQDPSCGFVLANEIRLDGFSQQSLTPVVEPMALGVMQATLQGVGNKAWLSDSGFYQAKFSFDERPSHMGQNSPPLAMLQYYGGQLPCGWHYPLAESSQALALQVPGMASPCLLGAWATDVGSAVVTAQNCTQHLIMMASGQQCLWDDRQAQQAWRLQCHEGHAMMLRSHKQQGGLFCECVQGDAIIQVGDDSELCSYAAISYQIQKSYLMQVAGNVTIMVEQNMMWQAGNRIQCMAQAEGRFAAQENIHLHSDHISLVANNNIDYSVGGELRWHTSQGALNIHAANSIFITTQEFQWGHSQASLASSRNGFMLKAKQLTFKADEINIKSKESFSL